MEKEIISNETKRKLLKSTHPKYFARNLKLFTLCYSLNAVICFLLYFINPEPFPFLLYWGIFLLGIVASRLMNNWFIKNQQYRIYSLFKTIDRLLDDGFNHNTRMRKLMEDIKKCKDEN